MAEGTRYHPLPAAKRCGVTGCWCTPAEPPKQDYGTRTAEPGQRLVPRGGALGTIGPDGPKRVLG